MNGVCLIYIVEKWHSGRHLTIARCRSCGWNGGERIDEPSKTLSAAKRHSKSCPNLKDQEGIAS